MIFLRNTYLAKPNTLFDIDKAVRRAAHTLIDKVNEKYDLYKAFIYTADSASGNSGYSSIAIVLIGSPRASLLSADSDIIKWGYEVSATSNVKFYTNVFFQNQFESSELISCSSLIENIKNTGIEVI
jgi:hypothetical protein